MVVDARKAHLYVTPTRDIYLELPPELRRAGTCGKLKRCLYGTRDAPARWEAFLAAEFKRHGFEQGVASSCCFFHGTRDLRCVVHGDGFVFAGNDADLAWVQQRMEESFLIKVIGKLGPVAGDLHEIRVLNRILLWGPDGVWYEADPRHAELLARDLETSGPAVRTAGAKATKEDYESTLLLGTAIKQFISGAARANYLSLDRADLSFATKGMCRRMATPRESDWAALLRIVKYLKSEPRVAFGYQWQKGSDLRIYVDKDFAGCLQTRRSTSGGCAMRGGHLVKHWSSTQKVVTRSSGEAELTGIVKGVAEGLYLRSLSADLDWDSSLRIYADSSAATGICRRSGIDKVRHLATDQLWVQERIRSKDFELFKVLGTENQARAKGDS